MAIMVSGGAGYIGSVAVEMLLDAGHSVVVFDNLSRGYRGAVHPDATFVQGDTRDSALLADTFAKYDIDTVMHFAAFALVGESVSQPDIYFENNVHGTHTLIKAMVDANIKRKMLALNATLSLADTILQEIRDYQRRRYSNLMERNRKLMEGRFTDPSVQKSIDLDIHLINFYDEQFSFYMTF